MDETRGRITRDGIRIYEAEDFAGMHAAGQLAARILDEVAPLVQVGVTTEGSEVHLRAAGLRSVATELQGAAA